jgi:LysM repeat protein
MVINKEVIFVGILAVACLGLLGVAFLVPKKAPAPITSTDTAPVIASGDNSTGTADLPAGSTSTTALDQPPVNPTTTTTAFPPPTPHATTGGAFATAGGTTAGGTTAVGGTAGGTGGSTVFGGTTGGGTGATGVAPTPPPADSGPKTYTITGGDTFADISKKLFGSTKYVPEIEKANPGVDPNALKIGQKINLPELPAAGTGGIATAPPAGTDTPAGGPGTYTVKAGDSLYRIAEHELGAPTKANMKAIATLNGMSVDDELQVGKVLKIPAKDGAAATTGGGTAATPNAPTPDAGGDNTYVVQAGDTVEGISRKKFGSAKYVKDIEKLNPGLDPNDMKIGQKLALPQVAGAATGATGTTGGAFGTTTGAAGTTGGPFGTTTGGGTTGGPFGGGPATSTAPAFPPAGAHNSLDTLTPPAPSP